jgi:hypothetical protein
MNIGAELKGWGKIRNCDEFEGYEDARVEHREKLVTKFANPHRMGPAEMGAAGKRANANQPHATIRNGLPST